MKRGDFATARPQDTWHPLNGWDLKVVEPYFLSRSSRSSIVTWSRDMSSSTCADHVEREVRYF
jgi:hypothetical protein